MSEATVTEMFGTEPVVTDPATSRERIRLFVNALRSGEWVQICGTLVAPTVEDEHGHRMCCALGVAIDVAIDNGIEGVERFGSTYLVSELYLEAPVAYRSSVPSKVLEWYGLRDAYSGAFIVNGNNLDYWNDTMRKSFDEIADMIEAEYLTDVTE